MLSEANLWNKRFKTMCVMLLFARDVGNRYLLVKMTKTNIVASSSHLAILNFSPSWDFLILKVQNMERIVNIWINYYVSAMKENLRVFFRMLPLVAELLSPRCWTVCSCPIFSLTTYHPMCPMYLMRRVG